MRKIITIILIILLSNYSVFGQDLCNHKKLIMNFLEKTTSINYKSSLSDFYNFFDSSSEIEIILRSTYIKNHPDARERIFNE
jgi:hypothetical protein